MDEKKLLNKLRKMKYMLIMDRKKQHNSGIQKLLLGEILAYQNVIRILKDRKEMRR